MFTKIFAVAVTLLFIHLPVAHCEDPAPKPTAEKAEAESAKPKKVAPTQEQKACTVDTDCVVIGTGGCCEADAAVNAEYEDLLTKPAADHCADEFHSCGKSVAKCKGKQCTVVNETFKSQGD